LDPQLASAHHFLGGMLVWADWDFEAGEAAFQDALRLDPNDAQTQVFFGHLSMILGRPDEAVRRGEMAIELDPLDPFVAGLYGTILAYVGRFEEAIEVIQDVLAKNPGVAFGQAALANALHVTGRHDEALQLARTGFARGDQSVVEALDRGFAEGGYTGAWEAVADTLATLSRDRPFLAKRVAEAYVKAGQTDKAIDWLERAVEQRDQNLPYLGVWPHFSHLHENPRFQQVAREVGIQLW
jgi:tetratricopeptide (TPR) repeat protein